MKERHDGEQCWHNDEGIVVRTNIVRRSREKAITDGEGWLPMLRKLIRKAKQPFCVTGFLVVKGTRGWKTIMFGAKKPISI
jgi:hypothetical protein